LFRVPTSAFHVWLSFAACTPVTTRPDFLPDPQASRRVLDAPPARVTPEIAVLVAAESLQVERVNVRDGYVETAWYDTRSRRSFRGAGDVPPARRHVALARHGHHGPRAPLADDTPRQLPPSRHEHRHLIASGDRQHAIQGLFGEAARDQHQQLALPHRAPAALGEGVVDVDRGVLRPVPPTEQAGEVGGETHDVQVWPAR